MRNVSVRSTTVPVGADRTTTAGFSAATLRIGGVLKNRFVLESRLGGGEGGTIFKATDRFERDAASRCVAIKVVHEQGSSRPERLSNLRREFHRTQSLCHQNIVKVYELDQADNIAFFTMEFIEGRPLSHLIRLYAPRHVPRPDAWHIIAGLSAGLAYAHSRRLVHGGLNPQNIMVTRAGEVRILDFRESRSCGGRRSRIEASEADAAAQLGPGYSCGEVSDGQPADPRDDVYSLACIAYELLAGCHPFLRRHESRARHFRPALERPPGLTLRQWRTLRMGLARGRDERPMSVSEWFARLDPSRATARGPYSRPRMTVEHTQESKGLPLAVVVPLIGLLVAVSVLSSIRSRAPDAGAHLEGSSIDVPAAAQTAVAQSASAAPSASPPTQPDASAPPPVSAPALRARAKPSVETDATKKIGGLILPGGPYYVRPQQDFVEIRVRRPAGSAGDERFSWWTESASAIPGTDFVPQGPVSRSVAAGAGTASLFVKLVPNDSRTRPEKFYVDVADADSSPAAVERIAVVLPPFSDRLRQSHR